MNENWSKVRALVSDVDGVLTNGSIVVSDVGEIKSFSVRDGMAIKLWQRSGRPFAILSGRASEPVLRRAKELGIDVVKTGRLDKQTAMEEIAESLGIPPNEMAYVGDDLPDLAPMSMSAASFCPRDAVPEVRAEAGMVVDVNGGSGVIREVVECLLKANGQWDEIVDSYRVKP